ncbi:DUF2190 family protein [Mucisphaera calidilacus]|uniref:DUF2190 family protein n=1 Tax=Mucisphaera calidilacus TaxID=2527982 RepID=A0A518BVN9_9BACT|nr:DUF2190 family protein [Mucisphaera calidilacus]QDU71045.1 hypothetical protein Pan265_08900 [Mucisphaera calidilacus]
MTQARFIHEGKGIDYTPAPGSDVSAGDIVVLGDGLVGIAKHDIAAGQLGTLELTGVYDIAKASGIIAAGEKVYWDADGNPLDGVALSGAATTTEPSNTLLGKAVADAANGDPAVRAVLLQNA